MKFKKFEKFWIWKLYFQRVIYHRIFVGFTWKVHGQKGQYLKFSKCFTVFSYDRTQRCRIFFFPGKVTFSMKSGKKEWVSKISGIFFFRLRGKKIPPYFSSTKKYRLISAKTVNPIFLLKLSISNEKITQPIFAKTDDFSGNKKIPPYFFQNCQFQRK